MIRRRAKPDGLPFRVYERHGSRVYSIGHKSASGSWTFRLRCPADDAAQIAQTRREAIKRATDIAAGMPSEGTFAALADAWLAWQRSLPERSATRRADTTLAENVRELAALKRTYGPMPLGDLVKADAYVHLDACAAADRAAKGNKEIALARVVLEWAVRRGRLTANPFDGVEKLATVKHDRLVSDQELALAVEVGRAMGGPQHIVALALRTAWLCVRRSVEVRALTRDQITEAGIVWQAAKRQRGEAVKTALIGWSPELRATIDEALAIKRHKLAGAWYLFGNLDGQRYTKGGWKATLARLMVQCAAVAAQRRDGSLATQPETRPRNLRQAGVSAGRHPSAPQQWGVVVSASDLGIREVPPPRCPLEQRRDHSLDLRVLRLVAHHAHRPGATNFGIEHVWPPREARGSDHDVALASLGLATAVQGDCPQDTVGAHHFVSAA